MAAMRPVGTTAHLKASTLKRFPENKVAVAKSDLLAQGLIVEAYAAGKRVPQDVAVVGFGNLSIAGEMRPTITSVDLDGARMVLRRRAARAPAA